MREFTELLFLGMGDASRERCQRLHAILDEALVISGGLQQSSQGMPEDSEEISRLEAEREDLVRDIVVAVLGVHDLPPVLVLRPAPLLLAWLTLKDMRIDSKSHPNDRMNVHLYVARTYALNQDEYTRLFNAWDDPLFESDLRSALDRGVLLSPRRKPAIGSRWVSVQTGEQAKVLEADEASVTIAISGDRDYVSIRTFFKEYVPWPKKKPKPSRVVKAKHVALAEPFSPTAQGRAAIAQAIADVGKELPDFLSGNHAWCNTPHDDD